MEIKKVTKKQSVELSKLIKSKPNWDIFNKTIKIIDADTNKTIAIFLKQQIKNKDLIKAGRELNKYAQLTTLRTVSAGIKSTGVLNGKPFKSGNPVMSSIVGYSGKNHFHPCRKTMLYNKHADYFDNITIELLQHLSKLFKKYAPKQYENQKQFVDTLNKNMILKDTVYTTITVNKDFRTLTHIDKGDHDSGLGNLMVFNYMEGDCDKCEGHKVKDCPKNKEKNKSYAGGEFLLPEYKIGFNMEEGDVLFVDVHSIHCNNPIKGKGRVSLVCYAKTDIKHCNGVSSKQLKNFESFSVTNKK